MHQLPPGCSYESGNTLVTSTFAETQLSKVRGILRAATRPSSISQIAQRYKFDEQKLKFLIDQLIAKGISGKVSKGFFVPTSFSNL